MSNWAPKQIKFAACTENCHKRVDEITSFQFNVGYVSIKRMHTLTKFSEKVSEQANEYDIKMLLSFQCICLLEHTAFILK